MKQILIIEDNRIQSLVLSKQLERLGYKVLGRIASGEEAIESVKRLAPDLILVNIYLEGIYNGIEVMTEIKTFSNAPFIYITGNSDLETKKKAMKTKPADYLVKPVDLKVLEKALTKAIQ
ncbi:MAG: response regulator [Balneolales bacterium]